MTAQVPVNNGIRNVGNTCYMNTAFQCLYHVAPFRQYVTGNVFSTEKQPILSKLQLIFHSMLYRNHDAIMPLNLIQALAPQITYMNLLEQNDTSEFMSKLIDIVANETKIDVALQMVTKFKELKYDDSPYQKQKKKMDISWCQKIGKEYSPFRHMFAGQHISQILCKSCKKIWHNYEIYQDISLPIPTDGNTLYDCLDQYFEDIELEDWKCDECGKGKHSNKTVLLWRTPRVLIIILKRFEWCNQSQSFKKNSKHIDIPLQLDLSKYTIGPHKLKYSLCSIAQHSGSYMGGHYTCICKNGDDWFVFDDDTVFKTQFPDTQQQNQTISSSGYIFLYESI